MRYTIVVNEYQEAKDVAEELRALLKNQQATVDDHHPEYVFVIGGDGTFLKAFHTFHQQLASIVFVPIKVGSVGFYAGRNTREALPALVEKIAAGTVQANEYSALRARSGTQEVLVVNELKVTNPIRPMTMQVAINGQHLERFRGTGLIFATPTGSTGVIKAAGGAVLYPDCDLYEMLEVYAVSTNSFRTLNSPVVLSKDDVVTLTIEAQADVALAADTFPFVLSGDTLEISLAEVRVKVLYREGQSLVKTALLKDTFVLDDNERFDK